MNKFDAHSDFGLYAYKEFLKGNNNVFLEKHYVDLNRAQVKIETITVGGDFSFWNIDFSKLETSSTM